MKRIVLLGLMGFLILLFVSILRILAFDFDQLTAYGYGYLIGKIVLLLVVMGIVLYLAQSQSTFKSKK